MAAGEDACIEPALDCEFAVSGALVSSLFLVQEEAITKEATTIRDGIKDLADD
jgi:hypothetical protein